MSASRSRLIGVLTLAVTGLALTRAVPSGPAAAESTLPFYDSKDFTPRWAPVSHQVAPFHLVDQSGLPLSEKDLDGKIHVASFFFAQCPGLCPTLLQKLKPVQTAARDWPDVMMLSYTVTPLTDTPAVLREFGALRGVDPKRWHLLTGPLSEISGLMRNSYFADDPRPLEGAPGRLLHSEKVLLVDGGRRLRGIYNGSNAFELERLIEDIEVLRAAGK